MRLEVLLTWDGETNTLRGGDVTALKARVSRHLKPDAVVPPPVQCPEGVAPPLRALRVVLQVRHARLGTRFGQT